MNAKSDNEEEIDKLNGNICEIEALENREKIMKNFKSFSDNPDKLNLQQMWKMNKKLWPRKITKEKLFQIQKPLKSFLLESIRTG